MKMKEKQQLRQKTLAGLGLELQKLEDALAHGALKGTQGKEKNVHVSHRKRQEIAVVKTLITELKLKV